MSAEITTFLSVNTDTFQNKKQFEISVTSVSPYFTQLGVVLRPAVTRLTMVHF